MARTVNGKECVTHAEIEKAYEDARKEKKKLEEQIPALEKKYNDIHTGLMNQMRDLEKTASLAGRRGPKNYNSDEKKQFDELMVKVGENNKNRDNDSKLKPMQESIKKLGQLINAPEYNIEALTGTWGPEKLPPKK